MDNETKTASEMWDIMEELGIAVDKSFFEPCDLTPPLSRNYVGCLELTA